MSNIFYRVEQMRKIKVTTGLTLREAIARESPEMQEKIRQEADRLRAEYAIMQIRNDLEISQAKLADRLGVSQAAVYKVEHAGKDLKLSTLKRYIEALGGKVSLQVQMPTGEGRIYTV